MEVTHTPETLAAFEDEVARRFLAKEIRFPVHLQGGCEQQLIDVFRRYVGADDWVLGSWRSHMHALLKGVPPEEVMAAILAGRSISLCFPKYRVLCSGIVGGTAPIAAGLAMGIKRKGEKKDRKVVCFLGDMAACSGIVYESVMYAHNHGLPVTWVIEDNGQSAGADTVAAWGGRPAFAGLDNVVRYEYVNRWPHVGVGQHVTF